VIAAIVLFAIGAIVAVFIVSGRRKIRAREAARRAELDARNLFQPLSTFDGEHPRRVVGTSPIEPPTARPIPFTSTPPQPARRRPPAMAARSLHIDRGPYADGGSDLATGILLHAALSSESNAEPASPGSNGSDSCSSSSSDCGGGDFGGGDSGGSCGGTD